MTARDKEQLINGIMIISSHLFRTDTSKGSTYPHNGEQSFHVNRDKEMVLSSSSLLGWSWYVQHTVHSPQFIAHR